MRVRISVDSTHLTRRQLLLSSAATFGVSAFGPCCLVEKALAGKTTASKIAKIEKHNFAMYNEYRRSVGLQEVVRDGTVAQELYGFLKVITEEMTLQDIYRRGPDAHDLAPIGQKTHMSFGELHLRDRNDPKLAALQLLGDVGHRFKLLRGKMRSGAGESDEKDRAAIGLFFGPEYWVLGIVPHLSRAPVTNADYSVLIAPAGDNVGIRYSGEGRAKMDIDYSVVGIPLTAAYYALDGSQLQHARAALFEGKKSKSKRVRVICSHDPDHGKHFTQSMRDMANVVAVFPVPNAGKSRDKRYVRKQKGYLKPNTRYIAELAVKMRGERDAREYVHVFKTGRPAKLF